MHEKEYDLKVPGDSHYTKGKDKDSYKYKLKFVFGVDIVDLVELLGPEAACKLLKYYEGGNMYIPKLNTIKRRVRATMIREEFKDLVAKGADAPAAEKHLAKKFDYSLLTIKEKLGHWYPKPISKKEKAERHKLNSEMDKKLVELLTLHHDLFKAYGIL